MRLDEETFKKLEEFAYDCKKALLIDRENFCQVRYPEGCSLQCWPAVQIRKLNPKFFRSLNGKGNVYAILTQESQSDEWNPKYVGERKSDKLRQRMNQHLVNKSDGTGSKLDRVKEAVSRGQKIAVTFIMVCPERLRHFVEETIIAAENEQLTWNAQNSRGCRRTSA